MEQQLLNEILRKLVFLSIVIGLDIVSGVVIAFKAGEFSWEKLPNFLQKYVPMIVGWLLAELTAIIPEDIYDLANLPIPYTAFTSVGNIAYGVVFAGGLGSFLANLANIGLLKAWLEKFGFKKEEPNQ
jgi:hypothetical protein